MTQLKFASMEDYNTENDPFVNVTERISLYNKLKFVFPGLALLPIRLTCGMGCVVASAIVMKIITIGQKKRNQPFRGWRRVGPWIVHRLARGLLFFLGFHRIHVQGKPAPVSEAPIVVANHLAPWEAFALMHFAGTTFISRAENFKIPVFGTVLRGLQSVSVNRDESQSRDAVASEIRRRTTEPGWPRTGIFPEGTVTNGKFLLQFRTGAFQAGVPVQPVVVNYLYRHCDPSWAGTYVGLGALTLRLATQWNNTMCLRFLPVYYPSEEEKLDPVLYANNVRSYMSRESGIRLSKYSLDDYMVLTEAKKYGIDQEHAVLGVDSLKRATNLNAADLKAFLANFHVMDKKNTGFISYDAFIAALGIPDSESTRRSFADICSGGGRGKLEQKATRSAHGVNVDEMEISFRAFLQSVLHISRDITTDEKIRVAFEIANVKGDGKISEEEVAAMISIIAPDMSATSVKQLFRRMDTRRVGYIDIFEFGAFFRANPHYMQLFEIAREMERAKGDNAVLEMLKKRSEGAHVTVEEFRESIERHRNSSPRAAST